MCVHVWCVFHSCLQGLSCGCDHWMCPAVKETLVRAMKLGERLLCVHYVEALMENFPSGEKAMMTMLPEGGCCTLHVAST